MTVAALLAWGSPARALIVAADDASQSAYNDGWSIGDNGGSGFAAWTSVSPGTSTSGTFIGSGNSDIGSGGSQNVWGLYGNSEIGRAHV